MKSDVVCPICVTVIGKAHGNDAPELLHNHILENHPIDYVDIANANSAADAIETKYRIYGRDLFRYRFAKLWKFYARNS